MGTSKQKPAAKAKKSVAKPAPKAKPIAKSAAKPKPAAKSAKPAAKAVAKPKADAKPKAGAKPAKGALVASVDEAGLGWIDAGKGYALTLDDGKLAARNDKGKRLSSVPKELRDGDLADQLEGLRDWLGEHARECLATVERWLLRSLPIPRAVLEKVWDDVAWRAPLENAVVVSADGKGAGLFRGVDPKKGVGIVDLDGETTWLDAEQVTIPHPILIDELDAWRELITQLGVTQGIAQLHRETHKKTAEHSGVAIESFEGGKFAMLMHAIGKARALGYKVSGGFATCKTWDAGNVVEARYWVGADSPDMETYTGQLNWVDHRERVIKLADVGPVAFSEGMRMASSIFAARVVEKAEDAS